MITMNSTKPTKIHQCHRCGVIKESKLDLFEHIIYCDDRREFICEECGELVVGLSKLNNHKRKHNSSYCDECGKVMLVRNLMKCKENNSRDEIL